ncbi:hypothetical protein SERLA73DRAFT_180081 [Serpula lacrymans var. lacrymans S7.3]|uniref:Early meiotic induction protein 1 n=2 Tax=Serpula lacrymans var. lacrymans TaxID=341189 RepID=F8PVM4_SERL3|nr:uncharacterized protein SERLADRAFT_465523 [Serpula lacrymans var. lacrymans S7.9]EGN99841.1 hypothetical protein SERLA73DRAFT_180081 [Serpula lacrymans var. lacrymans S7.3]EGO25410.1 hypothetical protein SERLADRAFT_465523 [Serpula lacrymans var. lacrymans S7.9]
MSNTDFQAAVKQEEAYLRQVHPTPEDIPGCMTLFDDFLLCNVLGAQVKSLYRFGRMSECKHKMEDFKFCMSLKSMHPEDKRDAWIRRRAEWWAHKRLAKSSENIWDVRKEPLQNWPPPSTSNDVDTVQRSGTIA